MSSMPVLQNVSLTGETFRLLTFKFFIVRENEHAICRVCQSLILSVAEHTNPTVTSQWTPRTVSDVFEALNTNKTQTKTTD